MTRAKWQAALEIYRTARDLPSGERRAFAASASADPEVVQQVLELLEGPEEPEEPDAAPIARPVVVRRAGERIGRYELTGPLGRGGMGEVYAARDTELGRAVALKFLLPEAIGDRAAVKRSIREARSASALNHPNIVTVYEAIQSESGVIIAMELVEGKRLREFCGQVMPVRQVMSFGRQIALALAAAHEHGIVHRDIKPENVMVRQDGYVKVLDFGLARDFVGAGAAGGATSASSLALGTPRYISPEQLRGEPLTGASDLFPLGIVLYELATGRHPFAATYAWETAQAITTRQPAAPAALNPTIPPELDSLILAMLAKNPEARPCAREVAQRLEGGVPTAPAQSAPVEPAPKTPIARRSPSRPIVGAAAVLVAAVVGAVAWYSTHAPSPSASPAQIIPLTSYPGEQYRASFSPDGKQVAFLWKKENESFSDVYVQMVGPEPPLRLTNDPADKLTPVWSLDGRYIAFLRRSGPGNEICEIPALGGPERKLGRTSVNGRGLAWSPEGKWLAFVDSPPADLSISIFLLSTQSGERRRLTLPPRLAADYEPAFSPDGRNVAFLRSFDPTTHELYVVPAAGGEPRQLTADRYQIYGLTWSGDGREIIFSSDRAGSPSLWRVPLQAPESLQRVAVGGNAVQPSLARQGQRLAFTERFTDSNIWRVENPRAGQNGKRVPPVKLIASTREDHSPQFSPDGSRIVFASDRSGSTEIWRCDSNGSNLVQLTNLRKSTGTPRWSPDGQQIVFDARLSGAADIFIIGAEGGPPRRLTTELSNDVMPSWSSDGHWIYFCSNRGGDSQVWKAPADGGQAIQITAKGGFEAFESPDGNYLYYTKGRVPGIWRVALKEGAPTGEEKLVPQLREAGGLRYWILRREGVFFVPEEHTPSYAIKFFDFRTGRVTPIAALERETVPGLPGLDVSPDGRWILYAQVDQRVSNIMLVEGFR